MSFVPGIASDDRNRPSKRHEEDDDDRPPICPACGVTMVPADLSAVGVDGDWVCLECEETG